MDGWINYIYIYVDGWIHIYIYIYGGMDACISV